MDSNADTTNTIQFSLADLDLFRDASGDRNPIHCSESYARGTYYGQRLAFGALGAVAALGQLPSSARGRIRKLVADFHRPVFAGIHYAVRINKQRDHTLVRLLDGSVPVLSLAVFPGDGDSSTIDTITGEGRFGYSEAIVRTAADITPGMAVHGLYRPEGKTLRELCDRLSVTTSPAVVQTLLWSSYLIGMELPGKNALFFQLSLTFSDNHWNPEESILYSATVQRFDIKMQQMRLGLVLNREDGRPFAEGEARAFVRPSLATDEAPPLESLMPVSDDLKGRVALVIGASRGLGEATARLLATQGTTVIAIARSGPETRTLPPAATGSVVPVVGSASDLEWLAQLRQRILSEYGRLDFLICSASPALLPLRLESNAADRLHSYIQLSIGLVLNPLTVFLDLLSQSGGCAVIISSSVVERPVKDWPHYITAKRAVEALAEIAPMQYPSISTLIVRPEKLLTEMINTPIGRQGAMRPETMAASIIGRLKQPLTAGRAELLKPALRIPESQPEDN